MLFIFPLVVALMFSSAAFMPVATDKKQEKDTRMYLVCDTIGDNCHWIRKEKICDESTRD